MKRRFIIALCTVLLGGALLTGCGNKQIFDTKYNFSKATIVIGTKTIEVNISKWKDYDDGTVQIIADDGQVYVTHSQNVLLMGK